MRGPGPGPAPFPSASSGPAPALSAGANPGPPRPDSAATPVSGPRARPSISRLAAAAVITRQPKASRQNSTSRLRPRGPTGGGGIAAGPLPKWLAGLRPCRPLPKLVRCFAAASAAAASTVPKPTWSSYPPAGRSCALDVMARTTSAGDRRGYTDLISAATPEVSAHAGLVPLTSQYCPSFPCAGTCAPGAATCTDRLSLEKLAGSPFWSTAATPSTPG